MLVRIWRKISRNKLFYQHMLVNGDITQCQNLHTLSLRVYLWVRIDLPDVILKIIKQAETRGL